jgi:hypothetical protein
MDCRHDRETVAETITGTIAKWRCHSVQVASMIIEFLNPR